MAIYAYVGLPGSGKSYGVVQNQVLPALREGRTVCTNVPLYEDRIRESVTTGELRDFPIEKVAAEPHLIEQYAPAGSVVIIDEVWRLFPAGQKVNNVPEPFKSFFAEHRHRVDEQGRSVQIVLVTQDLAQIGAFARQLVDQTFVHQKLDHFGASGSYQVTIYKTGVTGQRPPDNLKVRSILGRYDPKVYRLYKSHTLSHAVGDGANEKAADTRGNMFKSPLWIAGALIFLLGLGFGVPRVLGFFGGGDRAAAASPARASGATAGSAAASTAIVPLEVIRWRVAGVFEMGTRGTYALLESSTGETRWIEGSVCLRLPFVGFECEVDGSRLRLMSWPRSSEAKSIRKEEVVDNG